MGEIYSWRGCGEGTRKALSYPTQAVARQGLVLTDDEAY